MPTPTPRPPLKDPLEQNYQHDDQNNRHQDGNQLVSPHASASFSISTSPGTIPVTGHSKQSILKKLKKEAALLSSAALQRIPVWDPYIMPPMPPPGIAGVSSSGSATTTSVVTTRLPMEAAFCNALLVTIAGSTTPAETRSSYSPVSALNPVEPLSPRTLSTTIEPSAPAFTAICLIGSSKARCTILTPVRSSPSKESSRSATGS